MFEICKFDIKIKKNPKNTDNLCCDFLGEKQKTFDLIQGHGIPKVYILKFDGKIQYVGTTIQKQTDRLWQGLNGKYSYKWKGLEERQLLLFVVCFQPDLEKFNINKRGEVYIKDFEEKLISRVNNSKKEIDIFKEITKETKKQFIENIEAELVFKIRTSDKDNKWSDFQHEIHFNNFFDAGKSIAEKIFLEIEKH